MRVKFINAVGGYMTVDESRVEEYKAAGYLLAADVIDVEARVIDSEKQPKKRTSKKKAEVE